MKALKPHRSSTRVHSGTREWLPGSAADLLAELDHLLHRAAEDRRLLLYRGQRRREWRLDSTFVRSVKTKVFGMQAHDGFSARLRDSGDLNAVLTSLLLFKFGTLLGPSEELKKAAADHGLDAWFELMKRYQQYADDDMSPPAGTSFLDWSQSRDVGLYFANEERAGEGAIFVCDATATGKSQQIVPVEQILTKLREQFARGQPNGIPLLFCPPRQITTPRANNQQAVYFAQMELRLDMLEAWRLLEAQQPDETIILKIILPQGSEPEIASYLEGKGIVESFIYPDKVPT